MLSLKEISKIKEHLERAQNPVFFFDNDLDGLCSFLLLQRYLGRGKGVAIKSFPALEEGYFRKVVELNSDYVFILDKPVVSEDFFKRIEEKNIPVVWIDHHSVEAQIPESVVYINPCYENNGKGVCVPVTTMCYEVTNRKEDLWIAVIGSLADYHLPKFYDDFLEKYPELGVKTKDPFEVLYNSKIGEVATLLSSGLKDSTTNVVRMLRFLMSAKSPYDVLEESSKNYSLHKRTSYIQEKYLRILEKAKKAGSEAGELLFFRYSGDLSISGEISNHLKYFFPKKIIVVAYINGSKVNLSLRGDNVKEIFSKAIADFEGVSGGGHNDAVGGKMQEKDLDEFKKRLEQILKG